MNFNGISFQDDFRRIKILGVGAAVDKALLLSVESAIRETNIPVEIEMVTDLERLLKSGVEAIPALIVDGTVVSTGKLLSMQDIIGFLTKSSLALP